MFLWRAIRIATSDLIAGFVPIRAYWSRTLCGNSRTKKRLAFSACTLNVVLVSAVAGVWAQNQQNFPDSKAVRPEDSSTSPTSEESIPQATASGVATSSNPNSFANIRFVTPSWNWVQTPSSNLGTAGMNTITLSPCPLGIDTTQGAYLLSSNAGMTSGSNVLTASNNPFYAVWMGLHVQVTGAGPGGSVLDGIIIGFTSSRQVTLSTHAATTVTASPVYIATYRYTVRIAGRGTAEVAPVAGGTCTPRASRGTINVLTAYSHSGGSTVGSSSSGIQEAWNDAWRTDQGSGVSGLTAPYVKLMSNQTYNIYGSVYLRGQGGIFDGAGSYNVCSTRDRCFYVGTMRGGPYVSHHKVYNLSGGSTLRVDGVQVASAAAVSGTYTVKTAASHPFVVGDTVDCEINSQTMAGHLVVVILSVPNSTSFTFRKSRGSDNIAAGANTFGWCALLNAFVEDNSEHAIMQDVNIFQTSNPSAMGQFTYGIVDDNDQQFIIERAANRSTGPILSTANFPMGAFVYQRTDQNSAGIVYLHNSEFTGVNCVTGGGNGLVVTDTVCQGFPVYGIRYLGGLQPGTFSNIYEESTGSSTNPMFGYAAQSGYILAGAADFSGTFPASGFAPTFPSSPGGTVAPIRNYFIVERSDSGYSPPYFIGQSNPNNSGGVNITVKWPSPQLSQGGRNVAFDLLVTTGAVAPPIGTGNFAVVTDIVWTSACNTSGICTYVDTQAAPSSYTVQTSAASSWGPVNWFWPANLVLNSPSVHIPTVWANSYIVSNYGYKAVSIVADRCTGSGNPAQYSPLWVQCLATDSLSGSGAIGTVLQQSDIAGNGPVPSRKGRINLGRAINSPNDLITLADSNFTKTVSTAGARPSGDTADIAIGLDQNGGLALRSGSSISEYINALPNGANYVERLTDGAKTFNVPVTVNGNLTVASGTLTLPVSGTGLQCLHVSSTGVVSGTGADCGRSGITANGATTVNGSLGSYRKTQSKTSNFTISADQSEFYFNNSGTTREVDFVLPSCGSDGLWFTFGVDDARIVRAIASGGARIRNGSILSAANGSITASSTGDQVTIQCIGRSAADSVPEWVVTSIIGNWTVN